MNNQLLCKMANSLQVKRPKKKKKRQKSICPLQDKMGGWLSIVSFNSQSTYFKLESKNGKIFYEGYKNSFQPKEKDIYNLRTKFSFI